MELSITQLKSLDFILKSFEIEYGITYKLVFRYDNDIVSADFLDVFENQNNESVVGEHKINRQKAEFTNITAKHVKVVDNNTIQSFIDINAFAAIDREVESKNPGKLFQALVKYIDEFNFDYFETSFVYNVHSFTKGWMLPSVELDTKSVDLLSVVKS
ncbi:hypothetical protein ACWEWU_13940 [Staphylococcus xylosus]